MTTRPINWLIRYNALEVVPYHLILMLHQIALMLHVGPAVYGEIGLLFACIYFLVTIGMAGLYQQLMHHSTTEGVRHILQAHGWYVGTLGVLLVIGYYTKATNLLGILNPHTYVLAGLLLLSEIAHRTCKQLLYRVHLNAYVALTEIIGLTCYCTTVWSWYFIVGCLSLANIIIPLIAVSTISSFVYCSVLLKSNFPTRQPLYKISIPYSYIYERFRYAGSSFFITFFNGNMLILILGSWYGRSTIALFKLITYYLTMMNSFIDHIAGVSLSTSLRVAHPSLHNTLFLIAVRTTTLLAGASLLLLIISCPLVYVFCIPFTWYTLGTSLLFVANLSIDQLITPWLHRAYIHGSWSQYTLTSLGQLLTFGGLWYYKAPLLITLAALCSIKTLSSCIVIYRQKIAVSSK